MFKSRKTTIPLLLAGIVVTCLILARQPNEDSAAPLDAALAQISSSEIGKGKARANNDPEPPISASEDLSSTADLGLSKKLTLSHDNLPELADYAYGNETGRDAGPTDRNQENLAEATRRPTHNIENQFASSALPGFRQPINELPDLEVNKSERQANANATAANTNRQASTSGWQKNPTYRPETARHFVDNRKSQSAVSENRPERFASLDNRFALPAPEQKTGSAKQPTTTADEDWELELPSLNDQSQAKVSAEKQSVFEATPLRSQSDEQTSAFEPAPRKQEPTGDVLELPGTANEKSGVPSAPDHDVSFVPQAWAAPTHVSLPESVLHKSVHRIEYGKSLARKGSTFSAREEFIQALQIIAQGYDSQVRTNRYSKAFSKALIAMREAEDFSKVDSLAANSNIGFVVDGHNSKILSSEMAKSLGPIGAMQQYLQSAHEQLAEAVGQNPVSAEALYCLGKLHSEVAKIPGNDGLGLAKAIVFHRTALRCEPQQFQSANELGTLLARSGQLEEAKELLKQSLRVQQHPTTWRNLATIHERLGEHQLARLAQNEYAIALGQPNQNVGRSIQWMSTDQFNQIRPVEFPDAVSDRNSQPQSAPDRTASKRNFPSFNWPSKKPANDGESRRGPLGIF